MRTDPQQLGSVASPNRNTRRGYLIDASALAVVAIGLRLPALLATRHHHPDDGTYGVSALAMRAGGIPFREVFSSQGPAHLPLVWLFDFPRTSWSPRLSSLLAGVGVVVVTYLIGRRIATRRGALIAAALVATSGSMLWTTGPITSDGPTSLAVCLAFLVALRLSDSPTTSLSVALGVACAAGTLFKPALGILGCVPALFVVWRAGHRRPLLVGAVSAAATGLAVTTPFGFSKVWDQAIRYQLDSERTQSIASNASKLVSTLWEREILLLAALTVMAATLLLDRHRRSDGPPRRQSVDTVLVLWFALVAGFLVVQPALWRNHISALVVPLALVVSRRPAALTAVLVGVCVAAPLHVAHVSDILDPPRYGGPTRQAWLALERLPEDAQALSDEVGIVWRSGHRTPDDFVDASIKQLQQGRITSERVVAVAGREPVCAVLVWRSQYWGALPGLGDALGAIGYEVTERFSGQSGARVLYTRDPCD